MGDRGLEPRTSGLRVRCSTIELVTRQLRTLYTILQRSEVGAECFRSETRGTLAYLQKLKFFKL